jgi:hypothetical protein
MIKDIPENLIDRNEIEATTIDCKFTKDLHIGLQFLKVNYQSLLILLLIFIILMILYKSSKLGFKKIKQKIKQKKVNLDIENRESNFLQLLEKKRFKSISRIIYFYQKNENFTNV